MFQIPGDLDHLERVEKALGAKSTQKPRMDRVAQTKHGAGKRRRMADGGVGNRVDHPQRQEYPQGPRGDQMLASAYGVTKPMGLTPLAPR